MRYVKRMTGTTERLTPQFSSRSTRPALSCVAVFAVLGIVAYLPLLLIFIAGMLSDGLSIIIANRDFANYWLAGRMVLAGEQQDLFSQPVYFAHMQALFGSEYPIHNWGYPPHLLLLLWPLGWLGFKSGLVVFLSATFLLFAAAVAVFRREYAPQSDWRILLLALTGYVLMMVDTAQNGFLTSALLLFGLAWMRRRPVLCGLAFAFLTVKPQLGFLLPVLLLLDRNWRAIGWTAFFVVVLVGLSIALFGLESWTAYFTETVAYQRSVMTNWRGIFLTMMPTVFGSVRALGFSPTLAYLIQWPVTVTAAIGIVWLLWKETDPLRRIFYLVCGTLVISPYAFNYDMGALSAVAAILVGSQVLSRSAAIFLGVVAAIAPAVMNLGRAGLPIAPVLLVAALVSLALDGARRASETPVPG